MWNRDHLVLHITLRGLDVTARLQTGQTWRPIPVLGARNQKRGRQAKLPELHRIPGIKHSQRSGFNNDQVE